MSGIGNAYITGVLFTLSHNYHISVVDDDESLRESLEGLLKALGYKVEVFSSAESFLISDARRKTDCLLLDIRMPGMSGPELQRELTSRGEQISTIFITSHGSDEVVANVMAQGAVACLPKPFTEDALLKAISLSLAGQKEDCDTRGISGER